MGGSGVNKFEIKIDTHLRRRNTHRWIGWTLDKPKNSHAHLPSRVDYRGGNLVLIVLNTKNMTIKRDDKHLSPTGGLIYLVFVCK